MKPLVSAWPPLAGSPTRNTCISTTSPIVRPRPVNTSLIFFSTLSDCVLVSPKAASESAVAALSTTDGTWPLMKCSVAIAGTETASAIGKSEPGSLWRTMSSALALAASSDSAAGINNWAPRRKIFFFMGLSGYVMDQCLLETTPSLNGSTPSCARSATTSAAVSGSALLPQLLRTKVSTVAMSRSFSVSLKSGMPPRPFSSTDAGSLALPCTKALPASAGKAPGMPLPVAWWQAAQFFMNSALPSSSCADVDAAAPPISATQMRRRFMRWPFRGSWRSAATPIRSRRPASRSGSSGARRPAARGPRPRSAPDRRWRGSCRSTRPSRPGCTARGARPPRTPTRTRSGRPGRFSGRRRAQLGAFGGAQRADFDGGVLVVVITEEHAFFLLPSGRRQGYGVDPFDVGEYVAAIDMIILFPESPLHLQADFADRCVGDGLDGLFEFVGKISVDIAQHRQRNRAQAVVGRNAGDLAG